MAEHVFESPLVEEFYNSCHLKANGRFCSGALGKQSKKLTKQVPMSDAARASNAAIRGKAAKARRKESAKREQSKGAMEKMTKSSGKVVKAPSKYKDYGSGKTDPGALKMTQKYGTRQAGGAAVNRSVKPVKDKSNDTKMAVKGKSTATPMPNYGSGKTNPSALSLTQRYGGRTRGTTPKPKAAPQYGSGKTEPKALSLTERYGTRRTKSALEKQNDRNQQELKKGSKFKG